MQPSVTSQWRRRLDHSWRKLVYAVTDRAAWPVNQYLVNRQRRFLYCPIHKVACTSLKRWVLAVAGEEILPPRNEHHEVRRHSLRKLGGVAAQRICGDESYFSFAFVRNPWSRVVSAYVNKFLSLNCTSAVVVQRVRGGLWQRQQVDSLGITFRDFLYFLAEQDPATFDEHWRPQHLYLQEQRLDFLGRFESLQADFAVIQRRLGIETPLPQHNVTRYAAEESGELVADASPQQLKSLVLMPHYRQFYDRRLRDLVGQIYAGDVERFKYEF
jgi:hypothetical protein